MRRVLDVLPKVGSQEMSLASSPVLPVNIREPFQNPAQGLFQILGLFRLRVDLIPLKI